MSAVTEEIRVLEFLDEILSFIGKVGQSRLLWALPEDESGFQTQLNKKKHQLYCFPCVYAMLSAYIPIGA
jgi:hypothetical protein